MSCTAFTASAAVEKDDDIVILYTNDVHCGVGDYIGYDGLALYKREMEALTIMFCLWMPAIPFRAD